MNYYDYKNPFELENGSILTELKIAYHTYGTLNGAKDNVIWVCHALTANSDVQSWWKNLSGSGCALDTDNYFVVCANIVGSCYGTSGPLSINQATGQPYYSLFPQITIRDMVKAHALLCKHLEINKIHLLVGGSMGGYQALEWCLTDPALIEHLFLITSSARESAWGIAIHTAQRLAIEADHTWKDLSKQAGQKGLKAARAVGMIMYRSYHTYAATQTDNDFNKLDLFKASSYIEHQGNKLVSRFHAYSYWLLTKAMDSHNIARGRTATIEDALKTIRQKTLIINITGDLLCPLPEQQLLAQHIPNAQLVTIESVYAHDGFLVETEKIAVHLRAWLQYK